MLDPQKLHIRAAFFASIRNFFEKKNFLEVDTPLRQPVILPESNIVPISAQGQFLQSSPELCMKRLLASGVKKIFQICPCFRKDEYGRHHLEEFTMLEWYRVGADYTQLMEDCEQLLVSIVEDLHQRFAELGVFNENSLVNRLAEMRAAIPWPRLTVHEAFERYCPEPMATVMDKGVFDEYLVEYVEPHLGGSAPLFLLDYPAEMASLARRKNLEPNLAERFELYLQGVELANGFSELTDHGEQKARFKDELIKIAGQDRTTGGMPYRFLKDLEGLDDAAGIAMGLDRVLMLLLDEKRVVDVVTFGPQDFL